MVNKVLTFFVCAILLALSTLAMASSARDAPGIPPNDVSLSHNGIAITSAIPAPTDTFTLFAVDPRASPDYQVCMPSSCILSADVPAAAIYHSPPAIAARSSPA